jgi:hypothetical protein
LVPPYSSPRLALALALALTLALTLALALTSPKPNHGQARLWVPEVGKGERAPSGEPLFVVCGTTSRHRDRRVVVGVCNIDRS